VKSVSDLASDDILGTHGRKITKRKHAEERCFTTSAISNYDQFPIEFVSTGQPVIPHMRYILRRNMIRNVDR
jgi:hypothetical protein